LKIVYGDISYPKSEILVIPANSRGIMSRGREEIIAKTGGPTLLAEIKKVISKKRYNVGDYFVTEPARLKRRGVKKIYHCVIKRFPNDFTSLKIVEEILKKVLTDISKSDIKSVTVCGIGVEEGDLDSKSVARIVYEQCHRFENDLEIKIMDNNEDFIKEVVYFSGD
jgi:O-acetyl-ADP-ribose deacetylase (regulator of RNase III)